ncbi:alginate O-acetyltransferase AlgX-related protein [Rhizobium sp. 1399]|uniref:alginate O-acetyltransferase AlgX-related protein n=1 Tax=Rhizobium sp. 1399 TaxID=2817758 RepID=UPI002855B5D6|nr:hypothetical protein [Rhizobium sp. 1399]MDR6664967.1 hypothetical protein [Rhizobium sp. 1399]
MSPARAVLLFLSIVLLTVSVVPAVNLMWPMGKTRLRQSTLFNLDHIKRRVAATVYPVGVSIDPDQVTVGKQGWLHLGDYYSATLSNDRREATQDDKDFGLRVKNASTRWEKILARYGVRQFAIMIGPNKSAIYPETAPQWAQPVFPNPTDALLASAGSNYIDLRPSLLARKGTSSVPLYYQTDTHWNLAGAGAAFESFAKIIGSKEPDLRWPNKDAYWITGDARRKGGDLSRFLHLEADLSDREPLLGVMQLPIKLTQYDWETGEPISSGPNVLIQPTHHPILIHADGALNRRKVLWLRDSFGVALSPFMALTFSDVVQLHWTDGLREQPLLKIVDKLRPDFVFVTVVERDARNELFATAPSVDLAPSGDTGH